MVNRGMKTIGVLAIQGDFSKHIEVLESLGVHGIEVRESSDLDKIEGLILPGGESTTIGKLLDRFGMIETIKAFSLGGRPIFGTCAGLILLSKEIHSSSQQRLGLLDLDVNRNAYGRQIESFEADIPCPLIGEIPIRAVFIRAPIISKLDKNVEVLAQYEDNPVFIRQNNILACTFHPELTGDLRIHRFFLSLA
jgi:5'-phosphate synthase pdxT subunit